MQGVMVGGRVLCPKTMVGLWVLELVGGWSLGLEGYGMQRRSSQKQLDGLQSGDSTVSNAIGSGWCGDSQNFVQDGEPVPEEVWV